MGIFCTCVFGLPFFLVSKNNVIGDAWNANALLQWLLRRTHLWIIDIYSPLGRRWRDTSLSLICPPILLALTFFIFCIRLRQSNQLAEKGRERASEIKQRDGKRRQTVRVTMVLWLGLFLPVVGILAFAVFVLWAVCVVLYFVRPQIFVHLIHRYVLQILYFLSDGFNRFNRV